MEDNVNEDNHNGRQPKWKMTSMEDDLNVRQTSQLCNGLGPAQPQLVFKQNQFEQFHHHLTYRILLV